MVVVATVPLLLERLRLLLMLLVLYTAANVVSNAAAANAAAADTAAGADASAANTAAANALERMLLRMPFLLMMLGSRLL